MRKCFLYTGEKYFDFNVRHFHEKLSDEHGIDLSYTWVKTLLQGAGLVATNIVERGTGSLCDG